MPFQMKAPLHLLNTANCVSTLQIVDGVYLKGHILLVEVYTAQTEQHQL